MPSKTRIVIASKGPAARLRRAFARAGHHAEVVPLARVVDAVQDGVEAVVIMAPRAAVLAAARRLKTRFQMPLLPVVALVARPARLPEQAGPDAWIPSTTRPSTVVERVEELVRIRGAEREMVRLSATLAELAAENGRLYDRARRDAEATALLLRELQHRVRNNLAAIQALLVLERHRTPARPLAEALDVAIARLRSMAALQDSFRPDATAVDLAALAQAVARGALDVFGATEKVRCEVTGSCTIASPRAGAVAIVLNELITNALKHAHASTIGVSIRASDGAGTTELVVFDDGIGIPAQPAPGSGLMIVRAVVRNELAGTLAFLPSERGTRVSITIPTAARERAHGAAVGASAPGA
ncbi:MAG: sensor histidine kinase [Gemmatimonadaceae bacterium]|nr:sensor histidine kinase [Gemmatimonadaceae bacterium]